MSRCAPWATAARAGGPIGVRSSCQGAHDRTRRGHVHTYTRTHARTHTYTRTASHERRAILRHPLSRPSATRAQYRRRAGAHGRGRSGDGRCQAIHVHSLCLVGSAVPVPERRGRTRLVEPTSIPVWRCACLGHAMCIVLQIGRGKRARSMFLCLHRQGLVADLLARAAGFVVPTAGSSSGPPSQTLPKAEFALHDESPRPSLCGRWRSLVAQQRLVESAQALGRRVGVHAAWASRKCCPKRTSSTDLECGTGFSVESGEAGANVCTGFSVE